MDVPLLNEFLGLIFLGNTVLRWIFAAVLFVVCFVTLKFLKTFIHKKIAAFASKTDTILDDLIAEIIDKTKTAFLFFISIFIGLSSLTLPAKFETTISHLAIVIALLQFAVWGATLIQFWVENVLRKRAEVDSGAATTIGLINFLAKMFLYVVVFLMILNNLGVNITALIAGLGVGGIAIGLAVQNILGDLFGSLAIVLDKPFAVGDFVVIGDFSGTIENLGMKTTRIRSLTGEQLIFPNSDLLQSRIRNYKRMQERRVLFKIGVTYDTPADKIALIPQLIRSIIEKQQKIRFDRSHFSGFGDSTLDFETVWWVLDSDYTLFMDIQQTVNLEILQKFAELKIEFAFPTRTLYVNSVPTPEPKTLDAKEYSHPIS